MTNVIAIRPLPRPFQLTRRAPDVGYVMRDRWARARATTPPPVEMSYGPTARAFVCAQCRAIVPPMTECMQSATRGWCPECWPIQP